VHGWSHGWSRGRERKGNKLSGREAGGGERSHHVKHPDGVGLAFVFRETPQEVIHSHPVVQPFLVPWNHSGIFGRKTKRRVTGCPEEPPDLVQDRLLLGEGEETQACGSLQADFGVGLAGGGD